MKIYPNDEVPASLGADALVYAFHQTTIFPAFIPYHTDEAGNTYNTLVGETVSVCVVARVEQDSFYVKWAVGSPTAESVLENGHLMLDEVTARRLFPNLGDRKFKGDIHGKRTAGADHPDSSAQ